MVSAPPLPLPLLRMPKQKEREGFWFHFVYGMNYDSIWAWAGSGSALDGLALGSMTKGNLVTSFGFLTSLRQTATGASPRVEEAPLKFEGELRRGCLSIMRTLASQLTTVTSCFVSNSIM